MDSALQSYGPPGSGSLEQAASACALLAADRHDPRGRVAMSGANVWALILAAGEGSRLRGLTTIPGGLSVPKQFCSLQGGPSLLEETLWRAESVTQRRRMVTVVAAQHRRWWEAPLWSAEPENVIVQPENKGTAPGLLLPLLHIVRRDPNATVVVLPSDHFVRQEDVLARGLH